MASRSVIKWSNKITTSQVEQLIRAETDVQRAMLIFDSATAEYSDGFRHDEKTFTLIISKLVSANQLWTAEDLLQRMKEEQCNLTEDIFLSICRGYGRVHRPLDSLRVFQRMQRFQCKPSPKSYVTILDILVEENQLKLALRFYKHMRAIGVSPTVASLNVLIKALCKNSGTMDSALKIFYEMPNRGYVPDSYTYGTLINGLCKWGKISDARKLFEEMEINGCSPSVITYTSMIHGLCQSENLDEAFGLFEQMVGKGIEPNVFTFSSLMNGFCKSGCSSQAMELLEMMVRKRLMPNMITYSTLINGLCKEGKVYEALETLDRMKLQGLKPDVGLYGKIIAGFCDKCKFPEAANSLDEMILEGISPNRLTWSIHVRIHHAVVQGLAVHGEINRAYQLYLSMQARGISVDASTFSALVGYFLRKGDIDKAARVFEEMVHDGCALDEETWKAVVEGFVHWEKGIEAANLLPELIREQ
ncbi:pentatricopeptide repeat-containing protein At5g46100-like [Syzygium oleosum]|uniref:pentatricopeptide repeat-containing protein At5g46100-like n=1 Tax=Syzygium oleosum TaxID=219896 RepID=UPI0024BB67DD|nr:pentatricopeptide repeat-containing protein At5g46100-like [Syzygium oleosum]XP_056171671.1 pentatricopeptide repeat-containing protein At5g46100-like [Syzygium oleosum]